MPLYGVRAVGVRRRLMRRVMTVPSLWRTVKVPGCAGIAHVLRATRPETRKENNLFMMDVCFFAELELVSGETLTYMPKFFSNREFKHLFPHLQGYARKSCLISTNRTLSVISIKNPRLPISGGRGWLMVVKDDV